MYQATGVTNGCQRPAIIHASAPEGWIPMAAAMLDIEDKPPMWVSVGLSSGRHYY